MQLPVPRRYRETTGKHGDKYLNRALKYLSQSPLRNSDLGFYPYGKKLLLPLSPGIRLPSFPDSNSLSVSGSELDGPLDGHQHPFYRTLEHT